MRPECYFCHIKTIEKLVNKFKPVNGQAEDFIFSIHELLSKNRNEINPILATEIHRVAKNKFSNTDLYASEKKLANKVLMDEYSHWRNFIDNSNNPFHTAAKLAVVGNIIDYGAHSLNGDLIEQINTLFLNPLKIDKTKELKEKVQNAKSILYLGDNAGEIVFDKLFIETINHPGITYVARGYPIINDVTYDDVQQVSIDNLCKVISNGYDAPSTLLPSCSEEFLNEYNNADLIISKGQGNFEGLLGQNNSKIFFMLIAKCTPMADLLEVKKNDLVITTLNNN